MPKLDGMGVLRKIREQDKESFICIISADAFPDILREAAKLRVAGYVVKPIVEKKTRSIINKYEKQRSKEKLPLSVITDKKPFHPSERELVNAQWLIDSIQFPAVPEAVTALQKEVAKSEPDADYITEIISGDIKLSGMLLKQVNSAAYGLSNKVNSIAQAVVILGLKSLKNVLLASALREALGDQSEFDSDFWKQANATAVVSEALSQAVFGVSSEDAFLAGLFQDAGVLICEKKHARYNEVYRHSHSIIASILDFDRKILKTTHMAVSYLLTKQWELPERICDAILLSHNIDYAEQDGSVDTNIQALVSILKVSNHLVGRVIYPTIDIKSEGELANKLALEELMIDEDILEDVTQIAEYAVHGGV